MTHTQRYPRLPVSQCCGPAAFKQQQGYQQQQQAYHHWHQQQQPEHVGGQPDSEATSSEGAPALSLA